jgi:hypothetical protein
MVTQIKVRQLNSANDENTVKVEALLEGLTLTDDRDFVVWTVIGDGFSNSVTHGGGALEGEYLKYNDNLNPTIEILLPSMGVYNFTFKAEITNYKDVAIKVETNPTTGETRDVDFQEIDTTTYTSNALTVSIDDSWE